MATKKDPRFFVEINRIDEDERMVYGYGTREDIKDSYGTVIDLDSVRACMDEYMQFPTVREMHQLSAAGKTVDYTVDDIGVQLAAKVVDDQAWKKVKEGVYRGFSLGGKKAKQVGDRIYMKSISEFSLVDRPSNEGCLIDEYRIFQEEETTMQRAAGDKTQEGEKKYGNVKFADPENKKYPIDTEKHIRAAWNYINKPKNAKAYSDGDLKKVKDRIVTAWKEVIDKEGPPSADKVEKAEGAPEISRGYWDPVAQRYIMDECDDALTAVYALVNLKALLAKEQGEDHPEAQQQIDALISAISSLKDFVASEIMENDPADDNSGVVQLAGGQVDDITRAGAKISKTNMERIQAMHDHAAALGATCADQTTRVAACGGHVAIIGTATDDATVARLAGLLTAAGIEHQVTTDAEVQRLAGIAPEETVFRVEGFPLEIPGIAGAKEVIETLVERVAQLEAQPEPAKGVARVVGKEQDSGAGGDPNDTNRAAVEKPVDAKDAIKRAHQAGGLRRNF